MAFVTNMRYGAKLWSVTVSLQPAWEGRVNWEKRRLRLPLDGLVARACTTFLGWPGLCHLGAIALSESSPFLTREDFNTGDSLINRLAAEKPGKKFGIKSRCLIFHDNLILERYQIATNLFIIFLFFGAEIFI